MALWQKAGPGWGLAASGIDVVKGIGTVLLARSLGFDNGIVVLSGLSATCGQMWPVFKGFDGEKGNTTGFGAALAIAAWPTLLALVPVFLAIFSKLLKALRLKNVPNGQRFKTGAGQSAALPLGVALAFLALPLLAFLFDEPRAVVNGFLALFGLIMLRRLTTGLTKDLKTGASRREIFWRRLFLDRPVE
jgi:glycerol-3-phosphate acyltransferase PlsY